ncbi:MAG: hypothetical protein KKC68_09415 [Candidatus Thermoplasmatota archaeon]|nr:hypothetical protein [Candidatus Thermoplasmatota archaeon]MBU1941976.1 hypothetical protein [Candidatus Thermoplasmatota archaeon]
MQTVKEPKEEPSKKEPPKQETPSKEPLNLAKNSPSDPKTELEQKRNILKSIKDFDFQIKKNQEDIEKISEKIDFLTKDLDDLVSLYEIVSEQMNPFVGLSKVTKKRLDAIENFSGKLESLEERFGDLEAMVEKNVNNFQNFQNQKTTQKTEIQRETKEKISKTEKPEKDKNMDTPVVEENKKQELKTSDAEKTDTQQTDTKTTTTTSEPSDSIPLNDDSEQPTMAPQPTPILLTQSTITPEPQPVPSITYTENISDPTMPIAINDTLLFGLDSIIDSSFSFLFVEQKIEDIIDEYLHTLK